MRPKEAERRTRDIRPNKLMGQHFLVSRDVLGKIIAAAKLSSEDTVLEIGAGLGTLTVELAKRSKLVIAVEKDLRLIPDLEKNLHAQATSNVTIVAGDILKLFPDKLPLPKTYRVIANIPYYLTGRLIRTLLESSHPPREIYVTLQREVAERITARPPRMSVLAVAVQSYGTPALLFRIAKESFHPRPRVDSAFIVIREISEKKFTEAGVDKNFFFGLVRTAFQGRRKTLANSLSRGLNIEKGVVTARLLAERIPPGARPEELDVARWFKLAACFQAEKNKIQ